MNPSAAAAPAMGKRKLSTSKLLAEPKKAAKLDTNFDCPFCIQWGTVQCDIFHKYAVASCSVCEETFTTRANALTKPSDVYSEWIDCCEEANRAWTNA